MLKSRGQSKPIIRSASLGLLLLLLGTMLLVACGATTPTPVLPSPTPAETPVRPASTFTTPTAGATTAVATTQAATTAATTATQVATTAATTAAATGPKKGGNLKLALFAEPDSLDPAKTNQGNAGQIMQLIYDSLVYIGKDGLPKPWVAESWSVEDGGKTVTFKIRSGLKFHDGTNLDAKAVKFTFDRIIDQKTASPNLSSLGSLESVDVKDEQNVTFKFKEPYAPLFTTLSTSFFGIISPAAVTKSGDQYGRNPVGSGPFNFKTWNTGASIALDKNPDYINYRADQENKGAAYIDQVTFTIISEPASQMAALESGNLDITNLNPANLSRVQSNSSLNIIQLKNTIGLVHVEINENKAPLNQLGFRQAVSYAINRKQIVDGATNGLATGNPSPLPNGVAGWDATLNPYAFDPAKAKSILAGLGYTPGVGGILQKEGQPASLTLFTYAGDTIVKNSIEIMQSNLKDIGVEVKLQVLDIPSLTKVVTNKDEWNMYVTSGGYPDPSFMSQRFMSGGRLNRPQDPEVDTVLNNMNSTLDASKRLDYAKEAQKLIMDHAKIIPLMSVWVMTAINKRVNGYKFDPLGYALYLDIWLS